MLNENGHIFIHDWNDRPEYHSILEFYDIVDQQVESTQPGGGGVVVLKPKDDWREIYKEWVAPAVW